MEKIQILKELNKNIQDIDEVDNKICILQLAIYQKKIDELKSKKTNELKDFFEQKAKFYNQKMEKYDHEIKLNIENYKAQIEKLISVYNNLYVNVFKIMENAKSNQKIAIANIVTLSEKLQTEELNDDEIKVIKNTIIACAEKKLNYAVIIDECLARIKWCSDNVLNSINEVFKNDVYQLQIDEKNIFYRIKRNFSNVIFGKNKYKKIVENYENKYLKNIVRKNNIEILNVAATSKGVNIQMERTKEQILLKYQERMSA